MRERAGLAFELELWAARATERSPASTRSAAARWPVRSSPRPSSSRLIPLAVAPLLGRVDDSKKLTAKQREAVFDEIVALALAVGVGRCEACDIDAWGIVARHPAGHGVRAVAALACAPDYVLLDFLTLPDLACAAARHPPRRRALALHRGRIDRRQGDARPLDVRAGGAAIPATASPAQGLCHRRRTAMRSAGWAPVRSTA